MSDNVLRKQLQLLGEESLKNATEPTRPSYQPLSVRQAIIGIGPQEEYQLDRNALTGTEFRRKYGEVLYKRDYESYAPGSNKGPYSDAALEARSRTTGEHVNDASRQVAAGVVGLGGIIANFGLLTVSASQNYSPITLANNMTGVVEPKVDSREARAKTQEFTKKIQEEILSGETASMKAKTDVAQRQRDILFADSEYKYEQTKAARDPNDKIGQFFDAVGKFGRDSAIEAAVLDNNPSVKGKLVAEAIGSTGPALLVTGGTSALGSRLLAATTLKAGTKEVAKRGITSSTIGLIEGQGAYNGAIAEVNAMTHEQLMKSPDYKALIDAGWSEKDAKIYIADKAGVRAQLIQTALGTAAGYGVAKFEAAPFSRAVTAKNIKTVASQTIEETWQGATGQLSSNLGIREYADPNKNLTAGVGQAATQGWIGGMWSTQIITAPPLLAHAVGKVANKTGSIAKYGIAILADKQRARMEQRGPLGDKAIQESITIFDDIVTKANGIAVDSQEILAAEPGSIEPAALDELLANLEQVKQIPDVFIDTESDVYKARTEKFSDDVIPGSRLATLQNVLKKLVADPKSKDAYKDSDQLIAASEFAVEEWAAVQEFRDTVPDFDLEAAATVEPNTAKPEPTMAQVAKMSLDNFLQARVFVQGIEKANEVLNTSNKTSATVRDVMENPVGTKTERLNNTDTSKFTPIQLKALEVAKAAQAPGESKTGATQKSLEQTDNTTEEVRKQLLFQPTSQPYREVPSVNKLLSIIFKGAERASRASDGEAKSEGIESSVAAERLQNLVQNQINKVNAGFESEIFIPLNPGKDGNIKYETLRQDGGGFSTKEDGNAIYVNPKNASSLETFRRVIDDTNTGIRVFNEALKQFPELFPEGTKPFTEIAARSAPEVSTKDVPKKSKDKKASQETADRNNTDDGRDSSVPGSTAASVAKDNLTKVGSDVLSLDELFGDQPLTTIEQALDYLSSLKNLTATQKQIKLLIEKSAVFKLNPDIKVRQGTSAEAVSKSDGWFDPAKNEIVVFNDSISDLLHEMFHAVTLEVLNQNLLKVEAQGEARTDAEKAAQELWNSARGFLALEPENATMERVQAIMDALIDDNEDRGGIQGYVYAINEYMSYGLTKKEVSDLKTENEYARPSIAAAVKVFIKRMFNVGPSSSIFDEVYMRSSILALDETTAKAIQKIKNKAAKKEAKKAPKKDPIPVETAAPIEEATQPKADVADEVAAVDSAYITQSESAVAAVKEARDKTRELLSKLNFKFEDTSDVSLLNLERIASKYITGLHNDDPVFLDEASRALSYALYTDINESVKVKIPRSVIETSLRSWLETGTPPKIDKTVWTAIINSLNKLMSFFSGKEFVNIERALADTITGITTSRDYSFKPQAGFEKLVFQKEMGNNPLAVQVLTSLIKSGLNFTLTGSVAYADQVPIYRKANSPLHDVDLLFKPDDVDAAFEWFSNGDPENWGDAKTLYTFTPGGVKVIGLAVVPAGYEIRNVSSTWNVKANNPQRSYDVHDKKTGEKVGSYFFLRGSKETFEGIAGITIDLIAEVRESKIPQTFNHNGKSFTIDVSSYVGGFAAKLSMLRPKDVVDFKAVVPPVRQVISDTTEETKPTAVKKDEPKFKSQKRAFIAKHEAMEKLLNRQKNRTDLSDKGKEKLKADLLVLAENKVLYEAYKADLEMGTDTQPVDPVVTNTTTPSAKAVTPTIVKKDEPKFKTQKRISRADLKTNPDTLYLFGDNDQGKGLGGQAKEMRGEPNAVGIRTKNSPSTKPEAFWSDDTYEQNKEKLNEDFQRVVDHIKNGGKVVIPQDGLGTGLSDLSNKAPKTLAYIEAVLVRLEALSQGAVPKAAPTVSTTKLNSAKSRKDLRFGVTRLRDAEGELSNNYTVEFNPEWTARIEKLIADDQDPFGSNSYLNSFLNKEVFALFEKGNTNSIDPSGGEFFNGKFHFTTNWNSSDASIQEEYFNPSPDNLDFFKEGTSPNNTMETPNESISSQEERMDQLGDQVLKAEFEIIPGEENTYVATFKDKQLTRKFEDADQYTASVMAANKDLRNHFESVVLSAFDERIAELFPENTQFDELEWGGDSFTFYADQQPLIKAAPTEDVAPTSEAAASTQEFTNNNPPPLDSDPRDQQSPAQATPEPAPVEQIAIEANEEDLAALAEQAAADFKRHQTSLEEDAKIVENEEEQAKKERPPALDYLNDTLVKDIDGNSPFTTAYEVRPILQPGEDVIDLVNTTDYEYKVDDLVVKSLRATMRNLEEVAENVQKRLLDPENKLNQPYSGKIQSTYFDLLRQNQEGTIDENSRDVLNLPIGRALSIIEAESVDAPRYDEHLLRLATLAVLDYLMNNSRSGGIYKNKDIIDVLNLDQNDQITGVMREVANHGRGMGDVIESVGLAIREFWGAAPVKGVSTTQIKGISEGIAAEILDVMNTMSDPADLETMWVSRKSTEVRRDGRDNQTFITYKIGPAFEKLFGSSKTILRDTLITPRSETIESQIGKRFTVSEMQNTLKKDKRVMLSDEKWRSGKVQMDTPYGVSTAMTRIMNTLGKEGMKKALGYVDLSDPDKFWNSEHKASIEGRNLSIEYAIDNTIDFGKRVAEWAEKNNKTVEEAEIFFKIKISTNGRYYQQGFNPQNDKLAREMFAASRTKVDLTDPEALLFLKTAVLQAWDNGYKIEDLGPIASAAVVDKLLNGETIIDEAGNTVVTPGILKAVVNSLKVNGPETANAIVKFTASKDVEQSARLLKALDLLAQVELAQEQGLTELTTDLPLEIDGKTNGPGTNAVQNIIERFTVAEMEMKRRIGLFHGAGSTDPQDIQTYTKFRTQHQNKGPSADLYMAVGETMSHTVMDLRKRLIENVGEGRTAANPITSKNAVKALDTILELFAEVGDVVINPPKDANTPGSISIKRAGTKQPITASLYGSGAAAIAASLLNALNQVIAAEITDSMATGKTDRIRSMAQKIDLLSSIRVKEFEGSYTAYDSQNMNVTNKIMTLNKIIAQFDNSNKPTKERQEQIKKYLAIYKMQNVQFHRLRDNIAALYVLPFKEALSMNVGRSVAVANNALSKAAGHHGDLYARIVNDQLFELVRVQRIPINERTKEELKIDSTNFLRKNEELSVESFNKVLDKNRKFAPIIDMGATVFDLSSKDSETTTDVKDRRKQALEYNKKAQEEGAPFREAEPSFTPNVQMQNKMTPFSRRPTVAGAGVKILSYLTIAGADVFLMNGAFNDPRFPSGILAVHDGAEVGIDPAKLKIASQVINEVIWNSWQTNTIESVLADLKNLEELDSQLRELGAYGMMTAGKRPQPLMAAIERAKADLQGMANMREARIIAMDKVAATVDGGPGVGAPYVKEGKEFGVGEDQKMVDYLNEELDSALEMIEAAQDFNATERAEGKFLETFEKEAVNGSQFRKLFEASEDKSASAFIAILGSQIKDPRQQATFDDMVQSRAMKEILAAGLKINVQKTANKPGEYFSKEKVLNIRNMTVETALHELVHATTVYQVMAHFADREGDTNKDRVMAIKRLESLMNDFLLRDLNPGSAEFTVQKLLQGTLDLNPEPEIGLSLALLEFMAYSLSNQQLINRAAKTQATDVMSIARVMGEKVIQAMRRLLGFTSNKVFDHIRFNTKIIMQSGINNVIESNLQNRNTVLDQILDNAVDLTSPEETRRMELQRLFTKQVDAYLSEKRANNSILENDTRIAQRLAEYSSAELESMNALSRLGAAGFTIESAQDVLLFKSLQAMFSMDLKLDKLARIEAQKIFEAVSDKLSPENFLNEMGTTGPEATQSQEQRAERMYQAVIGLPFTEAETDIVMKPGSDGRGMSDRLSVFLALSQTSPEFRNVLGAIDFDSLKLNTNSSETGLDGVLTNITEKTINTVNARVIGSNTANLSTKVGLDILAEQLLQYRAEAAMEIENQGSGLLNKANAAVRGVLDKYGVNGAIDSAADFSTQLLNNPAVPNSIVNLLSEIRGITDDTRLVFEKVKKAKQEISVVRQEYVERVPKIIAGKFSEGFSKGKASDTNKTNATRLAADWTHMFNGFGKTDLSVLIDTLGESSALSLFGNSSDKQTLRTNNIKDSKARVLASAKALGLSDRLTDKITKAYYAKAKQLGKFQIDYTLGDNLLTSATSIMGLYNEGGRVGSITVAEELELKKALFKMYENTNDQLSLIRAIDELASLEAVDQLPKRTHQRLAKIIANEGSGVKDALSYMVELRKQENEKTDHRGARINGIKGHMESTARRKYKVIIAYDSNHANLIENGYTRIRPYKDPIGQNTGRAYYFSAHQKLANYNQGGMQTVKDTFSGIDPRTGLVVGSNTTGGLIKGLEAASLNKRMKEGKITSKDNVLPRFSDDGVLIGFEQFLAPDMIDMLQMSTNYAESLGKWAGRIVEEKAALGFNMANIDALHETWERDAALGRENEYVEFGFERDPNTNELILTEDLRNDPVWEDSFRLIPPAARDYGINKFDGPIMIRRDMINNALGFRSASIADIYTGRTRWSKEIQDTMKDIFLLTPFLGPDMLKYLTTAEDTIQTIVSEVKHIIVVKSGIVLAANTLSNIVQLAGREVPLTYMVKRTRTKYAEVDQFKKNEERIIDLRYKLYASKSKREVLALQNQIETIQEASKRLSIWPLIEANQLTTISEGLTDSDKSYMDGKYMDWVEKKAAELPGALSTVARYAIVSKDTALYKGLNRAVQYSDFVAKAIYFDFLTQERNTSSEEALKKIDSEFINYDLVDSRVRTAYESIGLTWFMNFKLRSIKVALDLIRNNPASALLSLGTAGMIGMEVGSPMSDNLPLVTADGRLGYSLGPGMVQASWNLNPWFQLWEAID